MKQSGRGKMLVSMANNRNMSSMYGDGENLSLYVLDNVPIPVTNVPTDSTENISGHSIITYEHDELNTNLDESNMDNIFNDTEIPATSDPVICSEDMNTSIYCHGLLNTSDLLLNPQTGLFEEPRHECEDIQEPIIETNTVNNKRKLNQTLRLQGKEYDGIQKAEGVKVQIKKRRRQLKVVPCNHGAVSVSNRSYLCGAVNEQARSDIFKYFWSLSTWEAKKAYVLGSITIRDVIKRRKTTTNDPARKSGGIDCFLPREDGIKVRVCRDLFLSTLDITKDTFSDWTKDHKIYNTGNSHNKDSNGEVANQRDSKSLTSNSVKQWLDQLAKVPSHYCRSSSSRTYVDDALQSKTKMHEIYVSWCKTNALRYVQRKKFCEVLEDNKISIYKPRKDQCDTCVSYKEGNLDDEAYQAHISKKNEAREAKKRAIASLSDDYLVCTMDLQSVQLCPKLLVSSQYYKQKLQVHVFTIYVNNTKDVYLYVWHEGDGGVTSNEFATCIIDFIKLCLSKNFKKVTMISDGCGYQNRNKVLASALADISKFHSIEIEQIILEKGHTMMEVDSVHSTLEKSCTPPLYSPADYVTRMQKARPSQPYIIKHVDHNFFKDFEAVPSNYTSIRPGKKAGDPTVADIRSLLYLNGETYFKINHREPEWTLLPQRRKFDQYKEAQCLYNEPRKIEKSKWESLQSLKPFMHRDYHSFYDHMST